MVLFCCLLPWFISIIIIGTFIIVLLLSYWENKAHIIAKNSEWCCSGAQSCPILCDSMNCSTPGFPVLPYLLEFVQTHVHWGSDAIQPSRPLSSPSPPALNLSQHQGLFQRAGFSHQVVKDWCFSISSSNEYSGLIYFMINWFDFLVIQGLSRVFSSTIIWKH